MHWFIGGHFHTDPPAGLLVRATVSRPDVEGGEARVEEVTLLIDTGATRTSLSHALVERLDLPLSDEKGRFFGVTARRRRGHVHRALLTLRLKDQQSKADRSAAFVIAPIAIALPRNAGFDGLLGLDVLLRGTLFVDGIGGQWLFAVPDDEHQA